MIFFSHFQWLLHVSYDTFHFPSLPLSPLKFPSSVVFFSSFSSFQFHQTLSGCSFSSLIPLSLSHSLFHTLTLIGYCPTFTGQYKMSVSDEIHFCWSSGLHFDFNLYFLFCFGVFNSNNLTVTWSLAVFIFFSPPVEGMSKQKSYVFFSSFFCYFFFLSDFRVVSFTFKFVALFLCSLSLSLSLSFSFSLFLSFLFSPQ